jgi:hypothetical protein
MTYWQKKKKILSPRTQKLLWGKIDNMSYDKVAFLNSVVHVSQSVKFTGATY